MEKRIIVIGCGSNEAVQVALEQVADKVKGRCVGIHLVRPEVNIDELKDIALRFQETDHEVLIVSDGLAIAEDLVPKQDFSEGLRSTMPDFDRLIENVIKDSQHYLRDVSYPVFEEPRGVNPKSKHHRGKKKYWKK